MPVLACVHKYMHTWRLWTGTGKFMTRMHKPTPPVPSLPLAHLRNSYRQLKSKHSLACACDSLEPFFLLQWIMAARASTCSAFLFQVPSCSPGELLLCSMCPREVSVMMPHHCPNINTTSIGCTGSQDRSGWPRVHHFHSRNWFRDTHVLQTGPSCGYPGMEN